MVGISPGFSKAFFAFLLLVLWPAFRLDMLVGAPDIAVPVNADQVAAFARRSCAVGGHALSPTSDAE
eukprot:64103-Amphidinium_carterae.1